MNFPRRVYKYIRNVMMGLAAFFFVVVVVLYVWLENNARVVILVTNRTYFNPLIPMMIIKDC
jgi:hypothetical protein